MYRIEGLAREPFEQLFALDDEALAARHARRVVADASPGFPCRVSLRDAQAGEALILVNHVSHDVPTPYRTAYAIFVREAAEPAAFEDELPPVFAGRTLSLRGFDAGGMLKTAIIAAPGQTEARIDELFGRADVASIHAHTPAYGCFLAKIERN
jgi:uncharacterized protein DUF1203